MFNENSINLQEFPGIMMVDNFGRGTCISFTEIRLTIYLSPSDYMHTMSRPEIAQRNGHPFKPLTDEQIFLGQGYLQHNLFARLCTFICQMANVFVKKLGYWLLTCTFVIHLLLCTVDKANLSICCLPCFHNACLITVYVKGNLLTVQIKFALIALINYRWLSQA